MQPERVSKVLWFDVETTGLDKSKCAIRQIAALAEINGKVEDTINLEIQPFEAAKIEEGAKALFGGALDENRTPYHLAYQQFTKFLLFFVGKFDPADKFVLAGYNITSFDEPFLREFFLVNKDKYFGSYFAWPKIDVQTFVAMYHAEMSFRPDNFKLETVCRQFGIPIDAHDALSDIQATRQLYHVLRYTLAPAQAAA
jgi:DNA polymerase III alpha subunit (gram-positive type)